METVLPGEDDRRARGRFGCRPGSYQPALFVLLGAVGFVLLLALLLGAAAAACYLPAARASRVDPATALRHE